MQLVYYFLLHFIADFLLQSRTMGKYKGSRIHWLMLHGTIVFTVFALGGWVLIYPGTSWEFALCNAIIHIVIDASIWNVYKLSVLLRQGINPFKWKNYVSKSMMENYKYWEDSWFFHTIGFDQFLHAATIIVLWQYLDAIIAAI